MIGGMTIRQSNTNGGAEFLGGLSLRLTISQSRLRFRLAFFVG